MLLELLMDRWLWALGIFLGPIKIPDLPEEVSGIMSEVIVYVRTGLELLANWTHLPYLLTLFGLMFTVSISITGYNVVMWILRKVPGLGIS